jgi:glycosyltransferase involved in cell wall biosynthesis
VATVPPPRRILLVESNADGTVGGSHQAQFDLARGMDRSRYEPVVLFYEQNRFVQRYRDLRIETHLWSAQHAIERRAADQPRRLTQIAGLAGAIRRRARFIREQRIALVHLNNEPGVGLLDWLPAARFTRRPCIVHTRGWSDFLKRRLWHWIRRRYDRYISISNATTEFLASIHVSPTRIVKIFDGIEHEAVPRAVKRPAAEIRAEHGVANGGVLVTMVGHLRAWKGHDVVLRALAMLQPTERQRLRVLFIGGESPLAAEYIAHLKASVRREGLDECVAFLGERRDALDYMNAADIVLHASTIPEPFGLVVLEGMSLGKPVIASKLGGPSEIVVPGSGLLFDPAKPEELAALLRRMMTDPDERRRLGEGAARRVADFALRKTVAAVERLYDELLGSA